jgi:hypothetical protein
MVGLCAPARSWSPWRLPTLGASHRAKSGAFITLFLPYTVNSIEYKHKWCIIWYGENKIHLFLTHLLLWHSQSDRLRQKIRWDHNIPWLLGTLKLLWDININVWHHTASLNQQWNRKARVQGIEVIQEARLSPWVIVSFLTPVKWRDNQNMWISLPGQTLREQDIATHFLHVTGGGATIYFFWPIVFSKATGLFELQEIYLFCPSYDIKAQQLVIPRWSPTKFSRNIAVFHWCP